MHLSNVRIVCMCMYGTAASAVIMDVDRSSVPGGGGGGGPGAAAGTPGPLAEALVHARRRRHHEPFLYQPVSRRSILCTPVDRCCHKSAYLQISYSLRQFGT